jgi:hypothetical protein
MHSLKISKVGEYEQTKTTAHNYNDDMIKYIKETKAKLIQSLLEKEKLKLEKA